MHKSPFIPPYHFPCSKSHICVLDRNGFLGRISQKQVPGISMRQLLAVSFHTMLMQLYWVCILCSLKSFFFFALLRERFLLVLNVFCLFEFLFFFITFSISFPKCSKFLFIDIVYFPALIFPHFFFVLESFWLSFHVFR